MSLFRKPDESSSSEDESSDGRDVTNASAEDSLLSRINTVDSAKSAPPSSGLSGLQVAPTVPPIPRSKTSDHIRDLVLHSLLEDKATRDAADYLGKERSDPEVQKLAREAYKGLAQQLSGTVDGIYASDEMRDKRAAAQEGINNATRVQLTGLSAATNASATAAMAGASQALVPRSILGLSGNQSGKMESLLGLQHSIPLFLQGHPGLHTDRYAREYEELEVVGKGGYGKVFKVKHKLDNSFYAVKKIAVSPAKMQKIQAHGVQEMEGLLEEVRSLARFDHINIVRYHSAWFEFSAPPTEKSRPSTATVVGSGRLLRGASAPSFSISEAEQLHASSDSLSLFERASHYSGAEIVFETSDTGAGAEQSKCEPDDALLSERTARRKIRRGSEATIATLSSVRSHISAVEETLEEEEEEIETIPRSHEPTFEDSESMVSNSDMPHQLVTTRPNGPVLTLNVQMSLYDSNLAAFLSAEQAPPNHCFHPCISLELLDSIISGVQYLHSRGVVHRDLKPANVFLSFSTERFPPAGSVNLSSCHTCPARDCLHITPRIGDFGLVAALGDSCLTVDAAIKPVGTEFYRPPTGGKISEKLDVFALGVVALEMLQRFSTRMERIDALTRLRCGEFPAGFAAGIGDLGDEVVQLISEMVGTDEDMTWGCEEVKREVKRIVGELKR